MRAAYRFVQGLRNAGQLEAVERLKVELFGSLGATGKGHGTDKAVLLGLMGEQLETVDTERVVVRVQGVNERRQLVLPDGRALPFQPTADLVYHHR
jgi:L-serine dehydratase